MHNQPSPAKDSKASQSTPAGGDTRGASRSSGRLRRGSASGVVVSRSVNETLAAPTPAALRRRVRSWALAAEELEPPDVPGASSEELHALGVLGGLAVELGAAEAAAWPTVMIRWAYRAPRVPDELAELVRRSLAVGDDPLAVAYNACVSAANRRRLGTVFTPDDVVDHMLDRVEEQLEAPPACVVDPGAGVGAFTLAAARRWPTARIVAVDINVVTLGLLAARVCYERSVDTVFASRAGEIEIRLADYIDELPVLFAPDAPGPVVVLGNPPYTRTQALSADYKHRAAELSEGMITSGHANLAMLFQAMTIAQMRRADISCMVLPGSVVYTRAARDLRAAIWRGPRPVTVDRWPATARAFIGRDVQAAVIRLGPETEADPGPIRLARAETEGGRVRLIEEWALDRDSEPAANWYWTGNEAEDDEGVALADVTQIRRGLATGANSVFFLDDAAADRMPDRLIMPAVLSLRRFAGVVLTEDKHRTWGLQSEPRWLLAIDRDEQFSARVRAHLEQDPEVAERYLCSQREPWWSITDRPRPDILLGPLSKTDFKVVLNKVGAIPSNNLIGITVVTGSARPLADWLRSDAGQAELRRVSRRYHGGSHKVEPGDVRKVRVPPTVVDEMSPQQRLISTNGDGPTGGAPVPAAQAPGG